MQTKIDTTTLLHFACCIISHSYHDLYVGWHTAISTSWKHYVIIPPAIFAGVYSDSCSFVHPSVPISNPLLLLDRWTEFQEIFRNCSLPDVTLHLQFWLFIRMILGFPRAKQGLSHYNIWLDPSLIRYSS